jgi:hypothetical protein
MKKRKSAYRNALEERGAAMNRGIADQLLHLMEPNKT